MRMAVNVRNLARHYERALAAFEAALSLDPAIEDAHALCVEIHRRSERLDDGVELVAKAEQGLGGRGHAHSARLQRDRVRGAAGHHIADSIGQALESQRTLHRLGVDLGERQRRVQAEEIRLVGGGAVKVGELGDVAAHVGAVGVEASALGDRVEHPVPKLDTMFVENIQDVGFGQDVRKVFVPDRGHVLHSAGKGFDVRPDFVETHAHGFDGVADAEVFGPLLQVFRVSDVDAAFARVDHRLGQDVLELAYVARPVVLLQKGERTMAQLRDLLLCMLMGAPFEQGQRHGQGKITMPDGFVYEGEWADGQIHGQGRAVYANGSARMYGSTTVPEFRGLEGYEDHDVNVLATWNEAGELSGLPPKTAPRPRTSFARSARWCLWCAGCRIRSLPRDWSSG